ncbi:hypothetical protein J421_1482 [Gemmatirosa kalamazoonensis]|uniref:Uncharacterized protein n=1 Tax=Gemmatirosa kalamazoonensis TaxID=861299 RepID=W0RD14_9BACT|nr:hypothetical protein [Gemmatirosa kalamazoonensis]AHG89019.1 hypothetical protein J421_1482 [Gemmatirosa kalamazoonensis]
MTSESPGPSPSDDLRFDRVVRDAPGPDTTAAQPTVACAGCGRAIETEYWHLNGKSVCADCRRLVEAAAVPARGAGTWGRAVLYGLGAAIAGAVVYYAVVAITDFEIGIVAILIGYMVGWAVRKATGGRGARGFQILAAVLTYCAVGLAYTPLAFKGSQSATSAAADSARRAPNDSASTDSRTPVHAPSRTPSHAPSLAKALVVVFAFAFALPVIAVVGSLPSGLLSGAIIFFGLRQAWHMTGAPRVVVTGPYRVGAG